MFANNAFFFFFFHINNDPQFASINLELDNVSAWFKSNKLTLNLDKTK